MKHRIILLLFLCTVFLTACGNRSESATITSESPWPSHAPDATPYVRLQSEANGMPAPENGQDQTEDYESYEDIIRRIYAKEGNFYGKDWELQMFKDLPQDEPYPFVIRTNAMLQGADTVIIFSFSTRRNTIFCISVEMVLTMIFLLKLCSAF